jgi:hypothetical protein
MSELSDALAALSLHYSVEYLGHAFQDTWEHDLWSVTLTGPDGASETFRYRTGVGHRRDGEAVDPPMADVVHCLISDGQACLQDFEEWASDLGYDPDSRKAYAVWVECCETGHRLARVLDIEPLQNLEH